MLEVSPFQMQAETKFIFRTGNSSTSHTRHATDILHFESSSYLLIVDFTSRFPVVCKLSSMTGLHILNQCKQVLSEYGWSETLISDNGPCYTSQAFTSVMQSYSVDHITNSLHYQQSNGLAEKYVQIVKIFTSV